MAETNLMEQIVALCKRRGFIYQASEIYGGLNGFWDYGPLGAQLKKNLRDAWWGDMGLNPCGGGPGPQWGAGAHRADRHQHHPASSRLGSQWPYRRLQRSDGRLSRDQA